MRDLFRQYFTKGFGFGTGLVAILFTAGLLAVAVSTLTTFTTGTPAKASEVNANFAALKTAIEGIPSEKAWRLIAETDITTNTTSYTFSGLNGDTDVEYEVRARLVNAIAGNSDYYLILNGDNTGGNYGYLSTYGANPQADSLDDSSFAWGGLIICSAVNTGGTCLTKTSLYAKSGYRRLGQVQFGSFNSTTSYMHATALVYWSNTGSNITTMTITGATNALGVGTNIQVWARK